MEYESLDEAAKALLNHLVGAVTRQLHYADALAVSFSGGLDSTVLARILSQQSDVNVYLVTATRAGATDGQRARGAARWLKLPLIEVVVGRDSLTAELPTLARLVGPSPVPAKFALEWRIPPGTQRVSPVELAMLAPIHFAAKEARLLTRRFLLGQGADELFAGYQRHSQLAPEALPKALEEDLQHYLTRVRPIEDRIAAHWNVQFRYPYLDKGVVPWARRVPPRFKLGPEGERKVVLRRVGEMLGLPAEMVHVPKTAAQYGSGISELLKEIARESGTPQNEFLTSLL